MNVSKKRVMVSAALMLALSFAGIAAEETKEGETVFERAWTGISFTVYGSVGGGAGFAGDRAYPHILDVSAGLAFRPWFSVGGFTEYSPLSDFEHARLGLSIANDENAGAIASGTEFLFTPWNEKLLHPWIRVRLGGQTVGYLVDEDGKEGFESAVSSRRFYAGAAAGPELNISPHARAYGWAGWHYSANLAFSGIDKNGMSGFDAGFGVRLVFDSTVR